MARRKDLGEGSQDRAGQSTEPSAEASTEASTGTPTPAKAISRPRRRFLGSGGALLGAAAAGISQAHAQDSQGAGSSARSPAQSPAFPAIPDSMKAPGAPVGVNLYGVPSPFEARVVRKILPSQAQYLSSTSRTPLQELDGIMTPNGLFYERHHAGVPDIDPASHRLLIHGLVETPFVFTVAEVRRFPAVSRIHFLECSGNPTYKKPFGKTCGDLMGLLSCAEWTGVPVKTLLDQAGVKPGAKWVIAEGADGAGLVRSIPLDKCLEDALVVYSQNGERLRREQGYPLRLLLPGFEGNMNVKWLHRLKVSEGPAYSREETSKYTDLLPNGLARQFTFYMEAKSVITSPSGEQRIPAPGFVEIRGIAWSGHGKIRAVDVSVDGGNNWAPATLQAPILTRALTAFRFAWRWDGKPTIIQSRATDETGYVQPSFPELVDARGDNSFYHNNSVQPWRVAADGLVTNANNA